MSLNNNITTLLDQLLQDIKNTSSNKISENWEILDSYDDLHAFSKDFLKPTQISKEHSDFVINLLNELKVNEKAKNRYLEHNISINKFFLELEAYLKQIGNCEDDPKKQKFFQFVKLLQGKNKFSSAEKALLILLVVVSIALLAAILITVPEALSLLQQIIITTVFPLSLGIVYSLSILGYSIYKNKKENPDKNIKTLIKNNLWILSSTAFKIIGYSLLFIGLTNNNLIVPILLILAELMLFIKAAIYLIKLNQAFKLTQDQNEHQQARQFAEYYKSRNELIIRGLSATILSALVAIWFFIPGGLTVTIPVLLASLLVKVLKNKSIDYMEKRNEKRLIASFFEIENKRVSGYNKDGSVDDVLNSSYDGTKITQI